MKDWLLVFALAFALASARNCTDVKDKFEVGQTYYDKYQCGDSEQACDAQCEKISCYMWQFNGMCNIQFNLDDDAYIQACGRSYSCIETWRRTCPFGCVHGSCDNHACTCDEGFDGAACNEISCSTSGCGNGECSEDGHTCQCETTFSGALCDNQSDPFPFNRQNDPQLASVQGSSSLATSGALETIPWSDTYWPSKESGIAHRYNSDQPNDFNYDLPSKEELFQYTIDQLKELSPAEKYDIFMGRYDFPIVHSEWERTHPTDQFWEGLCHGWAPASFLYQSPNSVTLKSKDGLSVPFGASDVKGLLTYFFAMYGSGATPAPGTKYSEFFIGGRCNYDLQNEQYKKFENSSACVDVNPGTLHSLLTGLISDQGLGFVGDLDRSNAVWNQPIHAFESKVLSVNSDPKQATIALRMNYTKELVPQFEKQEPLVLYKDYEYVVDLDEDDKVIGGTWLTWDRPDFVWMEPGVNFFGYFASLEKIYKAATASAELVAKEPRPLPNPVPISQRVNHVNMEEAAGTIKSKPVSTKYRASWSLPSIISSPVLTSTTTASSSPTYTITLTKLNTERHRGLVKIFEGVDGSGPLLRVYSGSNAPAPFTLSANTGIYIEFVVDAMHSPELESSFALKYVLNQ